MNIRNCLKLLKELTEVESKISALEKELLSTRPELSQDELDLLLEQVLNSLNR